MTTKQWAVLLYNLLFSLGGSLLIGWELGWKVGVGMFLLAMFIKPKEV